ncbi:hypothetical protein KR074_010565, partial [Drosophila pseudoananassae]
IEDKVDAVTQYASKKGCVFAFIPPPAPHMGGLWEAGVKSEKQILLRAVGNARLSAEELQTVLVEVEGVLSRKSSKRFGSDGPGSTSLAYSRGRS